MSLNEGHWVGSGGAVKVVSVATTGYPQGPGNPVRLTTPVTTAEGHMELIVWDFDGVACKRVGDSRGTKPLHLVDQISSRAPPSGQGPLFTGVRDSTTKLLRLLAWVETHDDAGDPRPAVAAEAPSASTERIDHLAVTLFGDLIVTASLRDDHRLLIDVWEYSPPSLRVPDEEITWTGGFRHVGSSLRDLTATRLALTTWAQGVVTAVRERTNGDLRVDAWTIGADGSIDHGGHATAGGVDDVAVTQISDHRVSTAVRTGHEQLEVIVWDLSDHGRTVSRRGSALGPPVAGIEQGLGVVNLGPEFLGDQELVSQQFATACRETNGALKITLWNIGRTGRVFVDSDFAVQDVRALSIAYCRNGLKLTTGGVEVTERQLMVAAERGDGTLGLFEFGSAPDEALADIPEFADLGMTMQHQQTSKWCFAATGVSLGRFYNPSLEWTQCTIAALQFGQQNCCENPTPQDCISGGSLHDAIETVGHLDWELFAPASFDEVEAAIAADRPIGCTIQWQGGGRHAVAIDGYDASEGQFLRIKDPMHGDSLCTYETFVGTYRGGGSWIRTLYTKP